MGYEKDLCLRKTVSDKVSVSSNYWTMGDQAGRSLCVWCNVVNVVVQYTLAAIQVRYIQELYCNCNNITESCMKHIMLII